MIKLSSIPQIYRHVRRGTEILTILSRYGLADWLSRLNVEFIKDRLRDREGEALARHTQEKRIRLALIDLGPTFIKLGQLLSTRPDVTGPALAEELQKLQTDTPADPFSHVREVVEEDLGQPISEVFSKFDETPIASASIGQVHAAKVTSGPVVVKVQHKGIATAINKDLDILAGLATLAEKVPEYQSFRPTATVAELARSLRRELDFGREERNLQHFAALFREDRDVEVPEPFDDICTGRVLTMQRIRGIPLSDRGALLAGGYDLAKLAQLCARVYMKMIFDEGCFHADPHPGNLLALPGNRLALLDFGMVGRIDERLREEMEEMLLAVSQRDVRSLTGIIQRLGQLPPNFDESALSIDVDDFVGNYSTMPLKQIDLGSLLSDVTEIIHRHRVQLPPQAALLIKVIVTLEGTLKSLDPQISVIDLLKPVQTKIFLRRLSPARHLRRLRRSLVDLEQLAEILPRRLTSILEQIQTGKFDVHLDHRRLEPSVNRLVLGMLTSALFIGSALMLSQEVPPLLFHDGLKIGGKPVGFGLRDLSLLGLIGCGLSMLIGLRLLRAIGKSGHLDRRD
jgi:ubiquinone biosynthesis protein